MEISIRFFKPELPHLPMNEGDLHGSMSTSLDCFFGRTRLRSSSTLNGDSYRRPEIILDSTGGGPVPARINKIQSLGPVLLNSIHHKYIEWECPECNSPIRSRETEVRSSPAGLFIMTGLRVTAAIITTVSSQMQ